MHGNVCTAALSETTHNSMCRRHAAEVGQQMSMTCTIHYVMPAYIIYIHTRIYIVAITDMAGRQAWMVLQVRTLRADLKREQQGRGGAASPAMRGTASPATQAGPSVSPVPVRASVEPPRFSQ